ncbi:dTDP-4-dehydrorhamnose 3,5-epimerase [Roseibium sp.]|uniref:dTDP-4-dehydrorhamnose 3,5-epimerase n=1 Tax=Roseibium sp. TaxID=1936156 RepID=UPI003BA93C29
MSGNVTLIHPRRFGDDRGWFTESYNKQKLEPLGITCDFVQDNHSLSVPTGTLRGLHFQTPPFAQDKLVRCIRGKIFDVAVDIRKGSPTYGKWIGVELSAENGDQLLVPAGYAHGFVTLEDNTEVTYKVSNYYAPQNDAGLMWNDADIGIDWPLADGAEPILSGKDTQHPGLADFDSPFAYDGTPMTLVEIEP